MEAIRFSLDTGMIRQDEDLQLIRRIAAGDDSALRALVAACGQRMYAYALRLTRDPASADEVVQESLVAAWQNARRFRGEGRVIAWLLGIVHHKAMDLLRKRADLSLDVVDQDPPADTPSPDDQAGTTEQSALIRRGLEGLSPEHRAVLELVFYQGLSLQETARVCGCPLGTIKSRLSYAKNALRGQLNRQGLSAEDVL
jgi:RNA polymerase sigma-70 factor (ECF subfamily)